MRGCPAEHRLRRGIAAAERGRARHARIASWQWRANEPGEAIKVIALPQRLVNYVEYRTAGSAPEGCGNGGCHVRHIDRRDVAAAIARYGFPTFAKAHYGVI